MSKTRKWKERKNPCPATHDKRQARRAKVESIRCQFGKECIGESCPYWRGLCGATSDDE